MAGRHAADPVEGFFAQAAAIVAEAAGGAIADIRHKVVEEPWFGRQVTPDAPMAETLGWESRQDPARAWDALCDRLKNERGAPPQQEHALDHEIDR